MAENPAEGVPEPREKGGRRAGAQECVSVINGSSGLGGAVFM